MEIEKNNKDLLAPCGLYCGVCAVYIADRDDNLKFKERIINVYKPFTKTIEDIKCKGCLHENPENIFAFCQQCGIRDCVQKKNIEGCHLCHDFPCWRIRRFPMPVGKKVISRVVPYRKEHGTDKWVEDELKRYHCPECGNPLFRGAKRCNKCKMHVDID